ncbi:MAG: hypothetical protein Kapaf2KO_10680 [Candidatus Kapaibacteriales bacterium]
MFGYHSIAKLKSLLKVNNISKTYEDGTKALLPVDLFFGAHSKGLDSFTVNDNEQIAALVGASGCGKSTLMKLLAGFETPNKVDGSLIKLNDSELYSHKKGLALPPESRKVGLVFQDSLLFPNLSIKENIEYAFRKGFNKIKTLDLLDNFDIGDIADKRPYEISGGQARRVAIARTLASEPELLLLDEPFTGLDAELKSKIRDDIERAIRSSGVLTIIVTHDPEDAFSMADKLFCMQHGRIVQQGTPKEVYKYPETLEMARLTGHAFSLPSRLVAKCGLEIKSAYRPEEITKDGLSLLLDYTNAKKEKSIFQHGRKLVSYRGAYVDENNAIDIAFQAWEES